MDDLIRRNDAIRLAEQGQIQGFEWQFKKLCVLPSAEPKQKTGQWITGAELNGKGIIPPTTTDYRLLGCRKREFWTNFLYCSVCYKDAYSDTDYGFQLFDFCPFCGARMVGEEE